MQKENMLFDIHAYAGWNTSSNTIGTTLCQSSLYMAGHDEIGNREFLLHRYYEDIGYMAYARQYVTENYLPKFGLDYRHADAESGTASELVKNVLSEYMLENYASISRFAEKIEVKLPWKRMFEADIKLNKFV